jgi:hypothetical protein
MVLYLQSSYAAAARQVGALRELQTMTDKTRRLLGRRRALRDGKGEVEIGPKTTCTITRHNIKGRPLSDCYETLSTVRK